MLLAKHKKSLPFLIMIMLILIIGVVILFFTQISKKKVSFKTELFGLEELPEKWEDKVSYTVEADNSVVFTGLIDNGYMSS